MKAESEFKDIWLQWAMSSLNGLGTFLEFGIPCAVIECSIWVALELLVMVAGYGYINKGSHVLSESEKLNNREISIDFAAMMYIINLFGITNCFPVGFSYVCSAIIGGLQADNKSQLAKKYSKICYFTCQAFTILTCVGIHWKRKQTVEHFITNKDIAAQIYKLLPYVYLFLFL